VVEEWPVWGLLKQADMVKQVYTSRGILECCSQRLCSIFPKFPRLTFVLGNTVSDTALADRIICIEIDDGSSPAVPAQRVLSVEQLDAEVLRTGGAILNGARQHVVGGKLNQAYREALTRLLADKPAPSPPRSAMPRIGSS
jgi:hypothetical protein